MASGVAAAKIYDSQKLVAPWLMNGGTQSSLKKIIFALCARNHIFLAKSLCKMPTNGCKQKAATVAAPSAEF